MRYNHWGGASGLGLACTAPALSSLSQLGAHCLYQQPPPPLHWAQTGATSLVIWWVNKPFLQPSPGSFSLSQKASLSEKSLLFWPPSAAGDEGLLPRSGAGLPHKQGHCVHSTWDHRANDFFQRPAQSVSVNPCFLCIRPHVLLYSHW